MAAGGEPGRAGLRALACVALFLGGWWLAARSMQPPEARGPAAPAAEFSALRALERWRALPGSAVPHPVGSAAHEELRAGIVQALREIGCEPEVQETVVAHENRICAVRNVLVRLPGRAGGPAVLLCAHYDSVPAGPGAGDDGAGSASVLEIARALKSAAQLERDVILLVDDAEELGLLGARAFCEQHAWAKDVGLVVNLEARGTSGPCFLFETSDENAALITLAAAVLPHPAAWSASYEVYRHMQNDTDLTVFKRQGWQGYNLALVRGLRHYHTPRDDAAQLSADSLQQMGENALALVRGMAQDRLDPEAAGRAVYADFLDIGLLHWNQRSNLPIALGLALAIGFALWRRVRDRRWRTQQVIFCAASALGLLLVAAGLAYGLQRLALVGSDSQWPNAAEPLWLRAALGAGALACGFGFAGAPWSARASLEERWAGTAILLSLLALGLALGLPAASYLAIVPLVLTLLGFSLHEIARERRPQGKPWMLALPAFVGCVGVGAPLLVALEWVVEFRFSVALGFLAAFVFLPLWIMAAQAPRVARGIALAALALALGLTLAARNSPAWSPEHPAPLSLQHYQEAEGEGARWYFESFGSSLPAALAQGFTPTPAGPLGEMRADLCCFERSAPRLECEPAGLALADATIAIDERAGARLLILELPPDWVATEMSWRDTDFRLPGSRARRWILAGFGKGRLVLVFQRPAVQDRQAQIELFEIDELRKSAAPEWLDRRTRDFVPISWGDLTIVHSALKL